MSTSNKPRNCKSTKFGPVPDVTNTMHHLEVLQAQLASSADDSELLPPPTPSFHQAPETPPLFRISQTPTPTPELNQNLPSPLNSSFMPITPNDD